MSYSNLDFLEKIATIAIVRRDIRNNLPFTQIKAKLIEKFGDNNDDEVDLIYYRALEKENIKYKIVSN